jgi:ribose transport system substrate-binding protein
MKKIGILLAAATLLAGCGESGDSKPAAQKPTFKIGVSVPAATHGWTGGVLWNAEQAKKKIEAEHQDVEVIVSTGVNTAEQANRIEDLIARKVDALVILSQEPEPLFPACKKAKKAGIYLVIVSNPLPEPIQDHYVNGDNRSFGRAAAEAMGRVLNGQGDILVLEGFANPINSERVDTFRATLAAKYPGIRILDARNTDWNTEKGYNVMQDLLQKYPKIDAVWAGDDDVMVGALKAYEKSKRTDVKAMIGGGGSKIMVKKIMDGDALVKATVTYSPRMIEVGIRKALAKYKNPDAAADAGETLIPSEIVVEGNAVEYYLPDSVY